MSVEKNFEFKKRESTPKITCSNKQGCGDRWEACILISVHESHLYVFLFCAERWDGLRWHRWECSSETENFLSWEQSWTAHQGSQTGTRQTCTPFVFVFLFFVHAIFLFACCSATHLPLLALMYEAKMTKWFPRFHANCPTAGAW